MMLPQRRHLPEDRTQVGRKFCVGEYEGYIHVGLYPEGSPGDIFCDIAKEGTTLAGLVNALMISVSLGLQYGIPLEVYVDKFSQMRFEPHGPTNDPDIPIATSIVDYIFRWLGTRFLSSEETANGHRRNPDQLSDPQLPLSVRALDEKRVEAEAPLPGQQTLFTRKT